LEGVKLIIRFGTENDILKTSRLWLQMVNELAPEYTPKVEWWRKIALHNLKNSSYEFLVAESGGKLSGFIDWFKYPEPATGKLHAVYQHFFVLPEHRKSTLAGKLWRISFEITKKHGCMIREGFCFEKEITFWKRHGFNPTRVLMRKAGGDNV
jgi:GNAT superfamily N-acetyltransferase